MSSFVDEQHAHEPLPEKLRIVQLAKLLEVPAGELLKRVQAFDSEAKSVLSSISPDITKKVLIDFQDDSDDFEGAPDRHAVDELLATIGGGDEASDRGTRPEPNRWVGVGREVQATVDDDVPTWAQGPSVLSYDYPGAAIDRQSSGEGTLHRASEPKNDEDTADPFRYVEREEILAGAFGTDRVVDAETIAEDSNDELGESAASDPLTEYHRALQQEPKTDTGTVSSPPLEEAETAGGSGVKRRGMLLIAIAIVVGTTLVAGLYASLRPSYAAESEVVVTISGLGPEEIQRELQSFNVFASSQTVLAPVAESFDLTVSELRKSLTSTIVGDSTVIRFTVIEDDPNTALALNEAIVASYLEVANQPIDQDELAFVEARIGETRDAIIEIDSTLAGLETEEAATASQRLQIETDRDVAQFQLSDLQSRLVDLRSSGEAPPGSINFVQGQITEAETRLADLVAQAQALEEAAASASSTMERLRSERAVLRSELGDLEALKRDLELDQISGTRAAVFAPGHVVDEPVGLTPTRAVALGLLVGGALAYAWVFAATQLRRKK